MRKALLVFAAAMLVAVPAMAELQNVIVGGEVRIRANYYMSTFGDTPEIRWPGAFLPARPIGLHIGLPAGQPFAGVFGGFGNSVVSNYDWNDKGNDLDFVESRVRLNVAADFTDEVSAFIEIDSYDWWGEDFRSDYITGTDFAADSDDDVEIYQAYIQAGEMWGTPFRVRIGRQELSFGSEWLVGTNDTNSFFTGLSFDGIRATYGTDLFSIDAFATKLNEVGSFEEDGDTDFYGVYATWSGLEDIALDAYWFFLRDARSLNDTNLTWFGEWLENALGLDDYDPTTLHTVGLRGAGTIGAFDFELEGAYQFGDAGQWGWQFAPFGIYGDDDAEFDGAWAANVVLGYTFDMTYRPRVFLFGAYFDGEDDRDISLFEWLNPFDRPQSSVSFVRLFSNWEYSQFLDLNGSMSNFWTAGLGVSAMPTESLQVVLKGQYLQAVEAWDAPRYVKLGRYRLPINPAWSWWTQENDDTLGVEAELSATYNYSEDLVFEAGWAHLFLDDGLEEGNFTQANGLLFDGGTGDEDADYVYLETRLSF